MKVCVTDVDVNVSEEVPNHVRSFLFPDRIFIISAHTPAADDMPAQCISNQPSLIILQLVSVLLRGTPCAYAYTLCIYIYMYWAYMLCIYVVHICV
jgi:hypothetical protein